MTTPSVGPDRLARSRAWGGRGLLVCALTAVACATTGPVTPPPAIDPERLAQARDRQPGLTAEVELLEWRAREHAARGQLEEADRFARLARTLMTTVEALPAPAPPAEVRAAPPTPAPEATEPPASAERPRRRRRPKPAAPEPSATPSGAEAPAEPTPLEGRMQVLALALRRVREGGLDADGRVRVDAAQRALIDAQRALAAGAPERAKQHLDRVTETLVAIGGEPEASPGPKTADDREPIDALQQDLATSEVESIRLGGWLIVRLPEARNPANVIRRQRERLQIVGRLLRVYGASRACVGTSEEVRREPGGLAREAISNYLQRVEQLESKRLIPCTEALRRPRADGSSPTPRLFVGLTFAGRGGS